MCVYAYDYVRNIQRFISPKLIKVETSSFINSAKLNIFITFPSFDKNQKTENGQGVPEVSISKMTLTNFFKLDI